MLEKPSQNQDTYNEKYMMIINKLMLIIVVLLIAVIAMPILVYQNLQPNKKEETANILPLTTSSQVVSTGTLFWKPMDVTAIADMAKKELVLYGKDLIANTSKYLGPNGSVRKISNGLNCQNCHLEAGTAVFGNNYGSVASLYPKFRARSGTEENIYKRVNDCFERSLNSKAIDTNSKEMQSIVAYINYIGSNVSKGKKAEGSGLKDLAFLDRAADPVAGELMYIAKCQSCHQANGEGVLLPDKSGYSYPPLWGKHSFNVGAGLYRISNFAKYIKVNMPQGASHQNPLLQDNEAWDIAAYVLQKDRPRFNMQKDWPDFTKKPIDHAFGPYADSFPEIQHRLGPFKPIIAAQKKK